MDSRIKRIPFDLRTLAARAGRGQFVRTDVADAEAALAELAVAEDSEYYAFASLYFLPNLFPSDDGVRLCDVCFPSREVAGGTNFVREVWELPDEYLCLDSCEGEGCVLLSRRTGEVFDFSLKDRESFLQRPVAKWSSFFEFMRWNLTPPA
jgi:hypothetical protein